MNDIFLIFLSLSLSGSLIALLLILLKPIIKDRLSKTWQYYIFLVVVVRLLLPFGPETSLMKIMFNQAGGYDITKNSSDHIPDNITITPPDDTPLVALDENGLALPAPTRGFKQMVIKWLWLAWLAPASILLLRKVIAYCRLTQFSKVGAKKIDHPHVLDVYQQTCEAMRIRHAPGLIKNERIAAPMFIGTIRPVIVLSDTNLKDAEMQYIFQHELTHYRRLDIVYKWFVQIAVCLHWYNPIVYWINREINRNCELSCDEVIIKRLDEKSKYAYGDMLLGSIKLDNAASLSAVSINLNEDTKLIKERLKAIMTHRKKSRIVVLVSALLAVFLLCGATFAGAYTTAKPNPTPPNIQSDDSANISNVVPPTSLMAKEAPAVIDGMEIRYYEDENPDARWPYLHWIISNQSEKTITDYEMVCLAYDESGKPLELIWKQYALTNGYTVTGFTSQSDKSYEQVITLADKPILPGAKEDLGGGWSLWDGWDQSNGTHAVAYVLACMKQITFEDGTTWNNPDYTTWLNMYKEKSIDLELLQSYYLNK